jgi:hypothetical protein
MSEDHRITLSITVDDELLATRRLRLPSGDDDAQQLTVEVELHDPAALDAWLTLRAAVVEQLAADDADLRTAFGEVLSGLVGTLRAATVAHVGVYPTVTDPETDTGLEDDHEEEPA